MLRKQYQYLCEWKKRSNRKPLVIRGARQVGKTWLVREFAKNEYEHVIEINFDETPSKKDLFESEDVDKVIQYLSIDSGVPVVPHKTLVFLDEIQRAPELFARLRYFYEKRNDVHVIAAGSLLDFILEEHNFSMPVGRIEYMYIGPITFIEYLQEADENLAGFIRTCMPGETIPESIHSTLKEHLRVYFSTGGMPKALNEYLNTGSSIQCEMELDLILNTYRDDFSKYGRKADPYILRRVFDRAPSLVGRKVKYTEISREEKTADLKKAVHQLELARILYRVNHSAGNAVPLRAEKKERDFKLLFLDIGLLMRALGLNILDIQKNNVILSNKGALSEQFIGQQLFNSHKSYISPELYYWNRQKAGASSEVDYLIQSGGMIIPIEVKSGTTGSLKSLHVFASDKEAELAVRFNLDKPVVSDVEARIPGKKQHKFKLISLPLYMVSETERIL